MGKYSTSEESGTQSEYEDDEAAVYRPKKELGKGSYALAREFHTLSGDRSVVVLSPCDVPYNEMELKAKFKFFKTCYPPEKIHLYRQAQTYRLVLPLVPGILYGNLKVTRDAQERLELFLSAIKAVEQCHSKGYVIVDLHRCNILYDASHKESHIIDGGLSAQIGAPISSNYLRNDENAIQAARKKYSQVAPECFSVSSPSATEKMDVFSLGDLMKIQLKECLPMPEVYLLCIACQHQNPDLRPTLGFLTAQLSALSEKIKREKKGLPIDSTVLHGAQIKEHFLKLLHHHQQGILPINEWTQCEPAIVLMLDAIIAKGIGLIHHLLLEANQSGWNILMLSLRFHPVILHRLFDAIDVLEPHRQKMVFQQTDADGWNALMLAVRYCPDAIKRFHQCIAPLGEQFAVGICQQQTLVKKVNVLMLARPLTEPLLDLIRTLPITVQVNMVLQEQADSSTTFEYILGRGYDSIPSLLHYLHTLSKDARIIITQTLHQIPLTQFKKPEHLMLFWKLFGTVRTVLTLEERHHFSSILSSKHWYQMALKGWFPAYIKQDKVYHHILFDMHSGEQREVLELLKIGMTPLRRALQNVAGWWGRGEPDYAARLIKELPQKLITVQTDPGI